MEHQLELLRAVVRSPSTLGNERDAQELIAAELADIGLSPQMWDVGEIGPGGSPPLIGYERRPNVTALRRGTGGGRMYAAIFPEPSTTPPWWRRSGFCGRR